MIFCSSLALKDWTLKPRLGIKDKIIFVWNEVGVWIELFNVIESSHYTDKFVFVSGTVEVGSENVQFSIE